MRKRIYGESSGDKVGQVVVIGQRGHDSTWQYARILLQATI